ncbi:MAG: putative metal-dependent hydrolase [Bacteroidetes bacterium]|nr:MAG: putative metal-dependent hydrolase [Bacteroidota bacterium]
MEQLKYPIGHFNKPATVTTDTVEEWITVIANFPKRLSGEVMLLTDEQLDTPYRPEGWTIRQVVHHCADSHMNSLIRFKLALTEDNPTIKPYYEERWAELSDSKNWPIAASLNMLEGIHERWAILLSSLAQEQLARTFFHPGSGQTWRIDEAIGLYAWHCNHHLAHITETKKQNQWGQNEKVA